MIWSLMKVVGLVITLGLLGGLSLTFVGNNVITYFTSIYPSPTPSIIVTTTPVPKATVIPTQKPIATQSQVKQATNRTIPEGELIVAINAYRQGHGLSSLNTNQALCQETRKRVQDMVSINAGKQPSAYILSHDGMGTDIANGVLAKTVGLHSYGENIASAYCKRTSDGVNVDITTATQLVEWCFDSSSGHRDTLLKPDWTDVCSSGQFPFYVQTFAK